jgi:muramoyltetrapeptide carboxypeptidase
MKKIQPPFLKEGDAIGIAATARKVQFEEISPAIQMLKNKGFKVLTSSNLLLSHHQFAGTDEERLKGLQELLDNPDIKAILIARGGYGTVRILDKLDISAFKKYPKWICGFSDVTALLAHLNNVGFQSIHSTMPILFSQSELSFNLLVDILKGKKITYQISTHPLNKFGEAQGDWIGGNLSVLYSLMGSVSQPDYSGKILFIEDIDEYLYHIDRMMMQMKRSGILKSINGLIVGGFTDMKDNTIPFGKTAEEIIYDAVKEYDYPVCFNFPSGHIKDNYPFIYGSKIKLIVSEQSVEIEQG